MLIYFSLFFLPTLHSANICMPSHFQLDAVKFLISAKANVGLEATDGITGER